MGVGAEVFHQGMPVLDVPSRRSQVRAAAAASGSVAVEIATVGSELDLRTAFAVPDVSIEPAVIHFIPRIRSGSFAARGPRKRMEDEHICIDDLASHLGSLFRCPAPSAFYGVFDGHEGPDAAVYVRKHAMRLFFQDSGFPQEFQADDGFIEKVANSVRSAFLLADDALADDCTVSNSSGTTALTALVLGRLLLVANVGDCRAVLCRKGEAVEMSQDHRPARASERTRVEECGDCIEGGYVNGILSVTRALGDWELKFQRETPSSLIAEPEFMQAVLTEDDQFLIMGCDGIWDVMSSQDAVCVVRRGLQKHNDPKKCARELVMEALGLKTFDNVTAIVVCFSAEHRDTSLQQEQGRLRSCSLSTDALCTLQSWLNADSSHR